MNAARQHPGDAEVHPSNGPQVRSLTRWPLRIGVALAAIVVVLLLAELTLRVLDPFDHAAVEAREVLAAERDDFCARILEPRPPYPLALKPGLRTSYLGEEVRIGSHGLRNPEVKREKPEGFYRVLVLGDSVAFGWGVGESDCFPRVVETALNADPTRLGARQVQVINAAVPGWGLGEEYLFLREEGLAYAPDLVLVALVNNDIPALVEPTPDVERSRDHLPSWARELYLGRILERLLSGPVAVAAAQTYRFDYQPDPLAIEGLNSILAQFKLLCEGQAQLAVMDTICSERVKTFATEQGIGYFATPIPMERYWSEYAVSAVDDHPNAAAHHLFARAFLDWFVAEER